MLPFGLSLFHDRLSFRLKELIDDGVAGASVLGPGLWHFCAGLSLFGGRGPAGFWCVRSSVTALAILW